MTPSPDGNPSDPGTPPLNPPSGREVGPSTASESASTARSTGVVSIAILCSRILGLVRDQLLNGLFGAHFNGIFNAAFRTPNMLRDLFAEGALSTAFVTTFAKKIKSEGDEAAWALGRKMLSLSLCFMSMVAVAGVLLAPLLIRLLNPGWTDVRDIELCIRLAKIMYPFIAIVSVTALVMGMLNSKKIFFIPAVASAFFNIGCIVGGLILAWIWDEHFRLTWEVSDTSLSAFAVGTLIGGLLQMSVQLPALRSAGFRFGWDWKWKDRGVSDVLRLMWPSMIAASGTQVAVLLNSIFASFTPGKAAALSYLGNAQRLQQLPLGLFGVAVATVTLPMLSRLASEGMSPAFRSALARSLRLVFFLTLPAAVGLALLAPQIISVLFEHGRFTAYDVEQTVGPLQAFAFGLVFYSGIKVIQPAFYTIDRRFIPMMVSLGVIVFSATVNSITVFVLKWDHTALAWATGIGLMLNFATLYGFMRRFASGLETRLLGRALGKLAVAVGAMAGVCWLGQMTVLSGWAQDSLGIRLITLLATVAASAATYIVASKLLKVEETEEFAAILVRRFRRR